MQIGKDNDFCKKIEMLVEENACLKKMLADGERMALELKQLKESFAVLTVKNEGLLNENLLLKDSVKVSDSIRENLIGLQKSLSLVEEDKTSIVKLPAEVSSICEELERKWEEENETGTNNRENKAQKAESDAFSVSETKNKSAQEMSSSLNDQVVKGEIDVVKYKALQVCFGTLNDEKLRLESEKTELTKQKEALSSECEKLRQSLEAVSKEKLELQENYSHLKDDMLKLESFPERYANLQQHCNVLREEKMLIDQQNVEMQETLREALDEFHHLTTPPDENVASPKISLRPLQNNTLSEQVKESVQSTEPAGVDWGTFTAFVTNELRQLLISRLGHQHDIIEIEGECLFSYTRPSKLSNHYLARCDHEDFA